MQKVINNQRGATMIEYAIMLGAILAVCVLAVGAVGIATNDLFGLMPSPW